MKRILILLTFALALLATPVFAQEAPPPEQTEDATAIENAEITELAAEVPPPVVDTVVEIVQPAPDPPGWWSYLLTTIVLALLIPFVCQFVFMALPLTGLTKQIVAWIVGIGITFVFWVMNIGFTADMPALITVFYGWMCALAGNGLYDTGLLDWMRPKRK